MLDDHVYQDRFGDSMYSLQVSEHFTNCFQDHPKIKFTSVSERLLTLVHHQDDVVISHMTLIATAQGLIQYCQFQVDQV